MGKAKSKRRLEATSAEPGAHLKTAPWWRGWLIGLGLMLLTMAVYGPVYRAGFIWDDDDYLTQNANVMGEGSLAEIWFSPRTSPQYYPMVFTTFRMEHSLWGLNPRGYHTVNVLLHGLSAVLLWRLLARLRVPGGLLAAGIFAVHPVMVESVAWVTERKNVLSMVFYLSAMYAYLKWAGAIGGETDQPSRPWRGYALAMGLFICALLSKSVTASLPAAALLILWWQRGRLSWREVGPLLPFFVLGIAAGAHTGYVERTQVGAIGAEWDYSLGQRILMAGRAVWFYAGKLVWPVDLTFIYPKWKLDTGAAWQWIFPIAVLAVVAMLYVLRTRIGRGPLVAVLFFVGTLVPALGFVNIYPMRYSLVADHFQYHAAVGLIVLVAGWGAVVHGQFIKRFGRGEGSGRALQAERKKGGFVAGGVVCAVLGVMTFRQCYLYESLEILWRNVLAKNDEAWIAHVGLGKLLGTKTPPDLVGAEMHFQKARELAPGVGDAYYNLGLIASERREWGRAVNLFSDAAARNPRNMLAHMEMGRALLNLERRPEAIASFERALSADPLATRQSLARANYRLGVALAEGRDFKGALPYLIRAAELNPNEQAIWNWIGRVGTELGDSSLIVEAQANLARLRRR